jgi:creatinine amidohydrolase
MIGARRPLLAEMTSPDVRAELAAGRRSVVIPFAAFEQHGPHLPLDTDAILGDGVAPLVAERLDALCAPTLRVGCSSHHLSFAGTASLRPETLTMVVVDLVDSFASHGFTEIVLLPVHGGNEDPLIKAAPLAQRSGVVIVVPSLRRAVETLLAEAAGEEDSSGTDAHAGHIETSLMLALAPHLVRTNLMEPGYAGPLDEAVARRFFAEGAAALSANGVLGDPRGSTAMAGRAYLAAFVRAMADQVLIARDGPMGSGGDPGEEDAHL